MKTTLYFQSIHRRLDRAWIRLESIQRTLEMPEKETLQVDGRIRRWRRIPEAEGRVLRVVLLSDGETVHNAFFDRNVVL